MMTDLARFTEGDCHYLAKEISKRTGWPMYAFSYGDGFDSPDIHAFVLMPDGRALDVQGACTMRTMKRRWRSKVVREFPWKQLRRFGAREGRRFHPIFGRDTYARARIVADRLLAEINYAPQEA